ncbi:MAG: FkbM family methyltransferase [Novosphingobium sp.]|nr:FkbM family methyltransferase [Novosphingobium sp.]
MNEPFVSFAQNFEDVRLWRAFSDIAQGRYIDIGAQDPVQDSVSLAFYRAGWRGVHVEATPTYAEALREARPDEIVIQAAVSTDPGPISFFEISGTGLSTGVTQLADRHKESGWQHQEIWVPTVTLAAVLDMAGKDPIHWLKVDVEGMEADVLRSWGDHPARPAALVIEATAPSTQIPAHHAWYDLVLSRGYRDVLFDGLSRYFIHEAHAGRGEALALAPNVFDGFQVAISHFSAGRVAAEKVAEVEETRRQGAAQLETALADQQARAEAQEAALRTDLEGRLAAREVALAKATAAEQAGLEELRALSRDAARMEDQLAAQAEYLAAQALTAAAQRRELQDRITVAEEARDAARASLADVRVQTATLSGEHALALAQAEWTSEALQARVTALTGEIAQARSDMAARHAAWLAAEAELGATLRDRDMQIAGLTATVAQIRAEAARREEAWAAADAARGAALAEGEAQIGGLNATIAQIRTEVARREEAWAAADAARAAALAEGEAQALAFQAETDRLREQIVIAETRLATAAQLLEGPPDGLAGWPRKLATTLARMAGRRPEEALRAHDEAITAWRLGLSAPAPLAPEWTELPLADAGLTAEGNSNDKGFEMAADHGAITTVPALLAPHDAEFIEIAYQAVLGREPDPEGRAYYLARLRTGTHKLEILKQLRRSNEGQNFVPGVAGLDRAIRRFRLAKTPIIGSVLRLFSSHDGDSPQERQLRMVVNELGRANSMQTSIYGATREIGARLDQIATGQQALLTTAATMAAARVGTAEISGADFGNSAVGGNDLHQKVSDHQSKIGHLVTDYLARR